MTAATSKPRPYSRMETDGELRERIKQKRGYAVLSLELATKTLDQIADECGLARRIVWVTP